MIDISKATPRPWHHDKPGSGFSYVKSEDGTTLARVPDRTKIDDANGELIVKAVNLYDEIRTVLRDIEAMIAGCPDAPLSSDSLPQMILVHARAVLSKIDAVNGVLEHGAS